MSNLYVVVDLDQVTYEAFEAGIANNRSTLVTSSPLRALLSPDGTKAVVKLRNTVTANNAPPWLRNLVDAGHAVVRTAAQLRAWMAEPGNEMVDYDAEIAQHKGAVPARLRTAVVSRIAQLRGVGAETLEVVVDPAGRVTVLDPTFAEGKFPVATMEPAADDQVRVIYLANDRDLATQLVGV
jgi:hypothetical protein